MLQTLGILYRENNTIHPIWFIHRVTDCVWVWDGVDESARARARARQSQQHHVCRRANKMLFRHNNSKKPRAEVDGLKKTVGIQFIGPDTTVQMSASQRSRGRTNLRFLILIVKYNPPINRLILFRRFCLRVRENVCVCGKCLEHETKFK